MATFYMEKVLSEDNNRRFYLISNDTQKTLFGYSINIIWGSTGKTVRGKNRIFKTSSEANRYFDRQIQSKLNNGFIFAEPPFNIEEVNDHLQLGLPLF